MERRNSIQLVILIIVLVGVVLLVGVYSHVKHIDKEVKNQGRKLSILYDFFNGQVNLEQQVKEEKEDQCVLLEVVNEFKSANFTTMAEFSPTNNTFAVLCGDGSVQIYDAENSELLNTLKKSGDRITAMAYCPDGNSLLTGTDSGKLLLWDLKSGEFRLTKKVGEKAIARVDAGQNNRAVFSVTRDFEESKNTKDAKVIDISTGEVLSEYCAHMGRYKDCAISHDGGVVAINEIHEGKRGAYLFEAASGNEIHLFYHDSYGCGPLSVDISNDNCMIAVGYAPYHVIVWNVKDEAVKWIFEGHSNWVTSLDFSDDDRFLVSGAGDSSARVYDLASGQEIGRVRFKGSSSYVDSVDISFDRKLVLAAVSGHVGIYRMP